MSSSKSDNPVRCLVGVGTIIVERKHMLVGVRKGSHCAGLLSFPGGHLESSDATIEECAAREPHEEILDYRTGQGIDLEILPVAPGQPQVFLRYDVMEGNKPYTTLFLHGRFRNPEGIDLSKPMPSREPDKCEEWRWVTLSELIHHHLADGDQPEETKPWIPLDLLVRHKNLLNI